MDEEKFKEHIRHKGGLKILFGLLLVVLIIFIGAKAKNEIENKANIVENAMERTITVSAEGKIYAKPDIGEINLGVTNEAKTVSEAQKQSTEAINKIMAFLKSAGIAEKDIRTANYNISPVYDYTEHKQTLRGYQVSQNLEVKIRDLAKSGDIIAGVTANGANIVGGLSFIIDDSDALKAEARKQAIEKAKVKAEKLADDLGVNLGELINFSEYSGEIPKTFYNEAAGMEATPPSPEIPTGENEIIVDISLTYEIK